VPKEVAKAELEGALAQLAMAKENVQQMEAQSRYVPRFMLHSILKQECFSLIA